MELIDQYIARLLAAASSEFVLRHAGQRTKCAGLYTGRLKAVFHPDIAEKGTIRRQEAPREEQPEPEIGPIETPVASELQPSTGQAPTKNSAPEPTPPQPPKELQPGDKVYVAGFGWVEYEGPNHCEDGADIYENGNKIGIMG